jgi:hypothetical protein
VRRIAVARGQGVQRRDRAGRFGFARVTDAIE